MAKSYEMIHTQYYNEVGTNTYLPPTEVLVWCRNNYGPEGKILPRLWIPNRGLPWVGGGVWLSGAGRILFADRFDAYVFKMRWQMPSEGVEKREMTLQRLGRTYRDLLYGRYHLMWPRTGTPMDAVLEWCRDHFGPASVQPKIVRTGRWINAGDAVYIRDSHDAVAFKMRWG